MSAYKSRHWNNSGTKWHRIFGRLAKAPKRIGHFFGSGEWRGVEFLLKVYYYNFNIVKVFGFY